MVMFCHSLLSDWNHGNAHFLRGIVSEFLDRGHEAAVYEPRDSWSYKNLVCEYGCKPLEGLRSVYPWIKSRRYDLEAIDLDEALDGARIVMVHEWNDHALVRRIGDYRKNKGGFRLFFHDTHHRSVTEPESVSCYDLSGYDGVLAFGECVREIYLSMGWGRRAWTWHEAADTKVFRPIESADDAPMTDLAWIGNWGDGERTEELHEFLLSPVKRIGLTSRMHGVRYPEHALKALKDANVEYAGWAPNYTVPEIYSKCRFTVHVPRRPYAEALPGIPTIRMFEAMACGVPVASAPWHDAEGLFTAGEDYLPAKTGCEMEGILRRLRRDAPFRQRLGARARRTILKRHTCAHRVDELLNIYEGLAGEA